MNLKELVQAQSKLHKQRSQEAEALCRKAYHLMAEAESDGFQDKELLKQAMRLFSQAMRQQKDYLDAYVGLSYLAILLNQENLARRYLEAALYQDPEHDDALKLLRFLEQGTPLDTETLAYLSESDRQYDELERDFFICLRALPEQSDLKIEGSENCRKALKSEQKQIQQQIDDFNQRIEALEQEFDTAPLRRRMQPLETRLSDLKQATKLSEQAQALHQGLMKLVQDLRLLNQELDERDNPDDEIEDYQDRLEQFKQRLNELSGKNVAVQDQQHELNVVSAILEQILESIDSEL